MNEKKIAIVSGGSRGIGKAIVESLLASGYIVATFSREETSFIKALRAQDPGENCFYWSGMDSLEHTALKDFAFHVYKKYKKIDALINNAGINLDKLISLTTDNEIQKVFAINVESLILLTRYISRFMMIQGYGRIINISSILGSRGFKGTAVYSASKAAVIGFTKSLARELGSKQIRVNAILPGFIDTQMTGGMDEEKRKQIIRRTPLGRLGTVSDIDGVVAFLLSDSAAFITGQALVVDGGLTC